MIIIVKFNVKITIIILITVEKIYKFQTLDSRFDLLTIVVKEMCQSVYGKGMVRRGGGLFRVRHD